MRVRACSSSKATGAFGGSYFERQKESGEEKRGNREKKEMEIGEKDSQVWNKAPF